MVSLDLDSAGSWFCQIKVSPNSVFQDRDFPKPRFSGSGFVFPRFRFQVLQIWFFRIVFSQNQGFTNPVFTDRGFSKSGFSKNQVLQIGICRIVVLQNQGLPNPDFPDRDFPNHVSPHDELALPNPCFHAWQFGKAKNRTLSPQLNAWRIGSAKLSFPSGGGRQAPDRDLVSDRNRGRAK